MNRIILLFCFLFSSLFGNEEIVVRLQSKTSLDSLYLYLMATECAFDRDYQKQIEDVLHFDLYHNGFTEVVSPFKEAKKQLEKENSSHTFHCLQWRTLGIDYVVKAELTMRSLSLSALCSKNGTVKRIEKIPLTGDLAKDRRLIHQLSDRLHEALFNSPGIASCHILYTHRKRQGKESTDWVTEVCEADYDGKNSQQITHDGYLCLHPTYVRSPKGPRSHHFLFVSYKIGQPKIYAASLAEGLGKRLTYLRGDQLMPALSLQQNKIAFISDATGNPDLFVQDFSLEEGLVGKARQIFTAPQAAQGSPTFSPESERIAFVSNKDGTPRIYVLTIPTSDISMKDLKPTMISKQNRDNTSPAWSPDGKKIAYASASSQGIRQIWIYDFTTGKETQLTEGPGHKENPAWAPNSLHLLFNSSSSNDSELYLINLNQKKAVKISSGSGEKRFPTWEPRQ